MVAFINNCIILHFLKLASPVTNLIESLLAGFNWSQLLHKINFSHWSNFFVDTWQRWLILRIIIHQFQSTFLFFLFFNFANNTFLIFRIHLLRSKLWTLNYWFCRSIWKIFFLAAWKLRIVNIKSLSLKWYIIYNFLSSVSYI